MRGHFNKLLILFIFFCITPGYGSNKCKPEYQTPEIPMVVSSEEKLKNPVYVFYDSSLSMTGFTRSQDEETNLFRPIINELQQISQSLGTETIYNTFGSRFETIDENRASLVTTESFYQCTQSAQSCVKKDKKNDIHKVLNGVTRDIDSTYIIVTDLFLSTSETLGKNSKKIKEPLRKIFNSGKSIGIFGVSSSFNGKISGIPTEGGLGSASYSSATTRPFYIIVIGSGENVDFVKKKLDKNEKYKDSYKFLMVTSNVVSKNLNTIEDLTKDNLINVNPESEGYKIEYDENNVPTFRFKISRRAIKKLKFEINNNDFIIPGSNGVSEYNIEQQLWSLRDPSCKKKNWGKATVKDFINVDSNNKTHLSLDFFNDKKIKWGYRYFVLANIYTKKNGTSSQDGFAEWNLTADSAASYLQQEPKFFKTLNLMNLIKMFNDVANEEFKPTLIASITLDFDLEKK